MMIYSGTSFSIALTTTDYSCFTDTGAFVSQEEQTAYITRHVSLEQETKDEVLRRAWRWLRGRYQFTAGFVHVLRRCGTKNASSLLTHYVKLLTGYKPTDDPTNITITDYQRKVFPTSKPISIHLKKLDTHHSLRCIVVFAINNFMLRPKPYLLDFNEGATMIELGIACYKPSTDVVIDEPLVIARVLTYFETSPLSMENALYNGFRSLDRSLRTHHLEIIGMFVLAQQLDGTKSLHEIFNFQSESANIGKGKAQLITIEKIEEDGTPQYSIVKDPLRSPFGLGYEAGNPSKHERWFEGTGTPFCFPDSKSGHDLGFFLLVDGNSIVFVMNQFKSYTNHLDAARMRHAFKTLSPKNCYKDQRGKIYTSGKSARRKILNVFEHPKISCLGVLISFLANPRFPTIEQGEASEHLALFDISRVNTTVGEILAEFERDGIRCDYFPAEDDEDYEDDEDDEDDEDE